MGKEVARCLFSLPPVPYGLSLVTPESPECKRAGVMRSRGRFPKARSRTKQTQTYKQISRQEMNEKRQVNYNQQVSS